MNNYFKKANILRERFEYFLAIILIWLSKILPENIMLKTLKCISIFIFQIIPSRRKMAISNLKLAYPELTDKKIYEIAKKNYQNLAIVINEILLIYNNKKKLKDFLENPQEALDVVNNLSRNNTKPILFTTAHFGNWEVLAHYFGSIGFKLMIVGREGNNTLIEKNITIPFRKKFGNQVANKDNAMMKMVKFLKENHNIGLLIDQKAGNVNSVITKFFNRECKTSKTIGSLKLKFNPIIIPIFALRQPNGKYKIVVKNFEFKPTGDKNTDILSITQGINNIFEEVVRIDPAQWFWMHNRWKID